MYPLKIRNLLLASTIVLGMGTVSAQDGLVNSLKINASEKSVESFKFTDVINLANTSIKNQGSSGTCWSYSTNSYLESEMIRLGKQPVEISQVFSARNAYVEKGKNYVRMHGAVTLGDGGELHDVINMYKKYGAVPQEVYSGLNYGTTKNKFAEMSGITEALLAAVVKNPNGELTPNWKKRMQQLLIPTLAKFQRTLLTKGKTTRHNHLQKR